MRQVKTLLLGLLAGLSLGVTSCSSEEENMSAGTGTIRIGVTTDAAFTKSVDETTYSNTDDYKVQILTAENVEEINFLYKDTPASIRLNNGSYLLKASYGTDSNASRNAFYVEGTASFQVNGETDLAVLVNCYPVCGKVKATFDATMDDYFTDYSIEYETEALKNAGEIAPWTKEDFEPWYLKLNENGEEVTATIKATRKVDGKTSVVTKTHQLARNQSWTMNIAPSDGNGTLGFVITIDEDTNDIEKDIVVPSEWI